MRFEARVAEGRATEFRATIATPSSDLRPTYLPKAGAVCTVNGAAGWQRITLPWTISDFSQSRGTMLEFIQQVRISAMFSDGRPGGDFNELALSVSTNGGKKKALFWADARVVTADGTEVPLSAAESAENVQQPPDAGQDYYGGPIKIAGIASASAIPTQPANAKKPAVLRIPLAGKNAVRFKATLGGDVPFGDESQRRKVYAVRSRGTDAQFLTVLEPYEKEPVVKSATAADADTLRVELTDGRVQEITLRHFHDADAANVSTEITESRNGKAIRSERTAPAAR